MRQHEVTRHAQCTTPINPEGEQLSAEPSAPSRGLTWLAEAASSNNSRGARRKVAALKASRCCCVSFGSASTSRIYLKAAAGCLREVPSRVRNHKAGWHGEPYVACECGHSSRTSLPGVAGQADKRL